MNKERDKGIRPPQFVGIKRRIKDVTLDEREYNRWLLGVVEDTSMKGKQYIIYTRSLGSKERAWKNKRYITNLGVEKLGFSSAKEFAMAIYYEPEKFKNIFGGHWGGYKQPEKINIRKVERNTQNIGLML